MPKAFRKVRAKILARKGNTTALIEGSRNARQLQRASLREGKLSKLASARDKQQQPKLLRTQFIRNILLKSGERAMTLEQARKAIDIYIHRNKGELFQIKDERRPGRPATAREDLLRNMLKQETDEFRTGFEVPDVYDTDNVIFLKQWSGEWSSMMRLKFIRIARADVDDS